MSNLDYAISFGPMADGDFDRITAIQNQHPWELVEFFENRPGWSPLSLEQVRETVNGEMKKPHTTVFAIKAGKESVGMGIWSASWDTWAPYAWLIIWPEHRRRGLGKQAAAMLLGRTFKDNPGHAFVASAPDWNDAAMAFIKSLGFKPIGIMRKTHVRDGKHHHTQFFDILKEEFLARNRGANP